MKRANRCDKPDLTNREIGSDKDTVEIKLARELKKLVKYGGRQVTKLDVMLAQAVNCAIFGNFKPLLTVIQCKELLNQSMATPKASKLWMSRAELAKLSLMELNQKLREAIANTKPLPPECH